MNPLATRALIYCVRQFLGLILLLLWPSRAGNFWQAWIFLPLFFVSNWLIVGWLLKHDPALLARRLKIGSAAETRPLQKILMLLVAVFYVSQLVVCRLDHHHQWSNIPFPLVIAGDAGVLFGLWLQFRVFRENTFGAATIELMDGQKVIATGPYARVRHPMYTGMILVSFATALALGSWYALPFAAGIALVFITRLFDEEKLLHQNLPGYTEYSHQVRSRLIPGIW